MFELYLFHAQLVKRLESLQPGLHFMGDLVKQLLYCLCADVHVHTQR